MIKKCLMCGKSFEGAENSKYCSHKCASKNRHRIKSKEYQRRRKNPLLAFNHELEEILSYEQPACPTDCFHCQYPDCVFD